MSATDSLVLGNRVEDNSGGILITDEIGPASGNRIEWNYVAGNLWDCGITVPSHSTIAVSTSGALQPAKGGVFDNRITNNRVFGNGILGGGAGILFAAAAPGGASYDNFIGGNRIAGNGQAGVTIHAHAPQQYVSGNTIAWNRIGTSNLSGDPDASPARQPCAPAGPHSSAPDAPCADAPDAAPRTPGHSSLPLDCLYGYVRTAPPSTSPSPSSSGPDNHGT